ncbi:MAG: hypothetical protein CFH01_01078 [Alphaproteobacteria bacterium MarineAlpha2_Bin1]|nr:MAG: hypothetical protein CFH01_01078 [Alphaproteobacteria bacterium MarineAlpha2_Bin1]|tara:strand:+ start:1463 stop:2209 length:747 start_codon:yes stop_codon:yes gene_type:complete
MNQKEKFFLFIKKFCNLNNHGNIDSKVVLDFGSGSGKLTDILRQKGIDAYGVDFYREGKVVPNYCSKITLDVNNNIPYTIPFESNFFDLTVSNNVFEHVMDYERTLYELSRVTKKNGISIHFFPSRYKLIEPHVEIPGATIFQSIPYLKSWIWYSRAVKYRGEYFDKLSNLELAVHHQKKLKNGCNYLTGKQILKHCKNHFSEAYFIDRDFFKFWPGKISIFYNIGVFFPLLFTIHSIFRMKILFLKK